MDPAGSLLLVDRVVQSSLRRGISIALACIAALILATIASPSGPQGTPSRVIAVVVAMSSAVMAVVWLRRGWPSPRRSTLFVVASSAGITALSLVQADPIAGLLVSTGFAVLGGYAGFFHPGSWL